MIGGWIEGVRSLLEAPSPAVLTTYRKDGSAHVSPVWFRWSEGAFEVVIAEGDLNWALANFPDIPAISSTQPSPVTDAQRLDYLKDAKAAYEQALSQYPEQTMAMVNAHFGLAAVAENGRNWEEAKRHYEAVKSLKGSIYQSLAEAKLKTLDKIQKPLLVGIVPEKPEEPKEPTESTTAPSTTQSTTTQSTTARSSATSMPTTAPATPSAVPTIKPTATTKPVATPPGK